MAEPTLTEVEGNPFEGPTLTPVEGDPFEEQKVPPAFIDRIQAGQQLTAAVKQQAGDDFDQRFNAVYGDPFEAAAARTRRATPTHPRESILTLMPDIAKSLLYGATVGPIFAAKELTQRAMGGEMIDVSDRENVLKALAAGGLSMFTGTQFSRVRPTVDGVQHQSIGPLPTAEDFGNAARVLESRTAEQNLRDLWDDQGIHPAEAAHDAQHDAFLREQLTQPSPDPKDRSGIAHPQGTTVPQGTPRTYLAQTGEPHIDAVLDSEVTNRNIDNPVVNDTYDVPYAAGGSVPLEDPTVFIDRHFPRSMTIDGVTFDPADPFTIHENLEQHVMEVLTRGYRGRPEQAFPDLGRRSGQYELPISGGEAGNIGKLEFAVDDNSVEVRGAYVEGDYQGKGFGIASYKRLADWALSTGRELRSGSDVSAQAARMYSALERRGYTVVRDPKIVTNHLGAASSPGRPAFRVIAGPEQLGPMDPATAYKVAHHEWAEKAEGAWYQAHGIDQAKAEEAYQPFLDQIEHENPANPPPNLYEKPYPHQDVRSAEAGPVDKPTAAEIKRAKEIMAADRATGDLSAAGADITRPENLPSLEEQPAQRPGGLVSAVKDTGAKLLDIGRDIQMMTTPMVRGSNEAMALAKDFANSIRRNRWDWQRIDSDIAKRFTPEQRKRMWDAADEESVLRQEGKTSEHMGLATLEPEERAAVEDLQTRSQLAWIQARDLGMVEGEGLPAYTPRMVINVAEAAEKDGRIALNRLPDPIGRNLRTRTSQMLHREHLTAEETEAAAKAKLGEGAEIARDIRSLPLATAKLEDAIAGRTLINAIEEAGKRTGDETVSVGANPGKGWFTVDHPAFRKWQPKFETVDGKVQAATDANGDIIFQQVPLYVRGDFEGPLRAVLTQKSSATYGALMALKGKTMGLIMNSPLIHNAVEWGRALPAMPGKVITFRVYFDGARAKRDVPTMHEAIDAGLVPIGKRFFNQDITSIMEEPNLAPGRSFTAQVLGFIPDLFDQAAGDAVKRSIDKAGDFWHNTLLWDRVGDLQMGLYTNFRDSLLAKGVDRDTAARASAHWANRYAGALPEEAMSANARKISNLLLFSRSFTLGNIGAMKDMFTGLPKDVMAQIERDGGMFDPKAIRSIAVRKAIAIVTLDMGLMYVGNSILQNTMNVLTQDSTLDKEMRDYALRFKEELGAVKEHPLKLLQPLSVMQSLSATSENEPGKDERIRVGYASDGTAIYARNPTGKIGEEFTGYMTGPLDMLHRKLGTVARPIWQIMANDKGFGHKVYDPTADTPAKYLGNIGEIAKHFAASQLPEGQIGAFMDLVKGEGDPKVNALQAFGPVAGVTFSKGAPGGTAVGELYQARAMHQYAVDAAMPDIRKQIQRGDIDGAEARMSELGIPAGLQRYYIRTTQDPSLRLSPKAVRDFYLYATPDQQERLLRAR